TPCCRQQPRNWRPTAARYPPGAITSTAAIVPQIRTSHTCGWPRKGPSASFQNASILRGAGLGAAVNILQLAAATAQASGCAVKEWPWKKVRLRSAVSQAATSAGATSVAARVSTPPASVLAAQIKSA